MPGSTGSASGASATRPLVAYSYDDARKAVLADPALAHLMGEDLNKEVKRVYDQRYRRQMREEQHEKLITQSRAKFDRLKANPTRHEHAKTKGRERMQRLRAKRKAEQMERSTDPAQQRRSARKRKRPRRRPARGKRWR